MSANVRMPLSSINYRIYGISVVLLATAKYIKTVRREIPLSQDSIDEDDDEKSHDKDEDEVIELNESEFSPPVKRTLSLI